MEFIKLAGLILISVLLISSLPVFDKSISALITISSCIIVLLYIINTISSSIEYIKAFITDTGFMEFGILFKTMGISFITQFVADIANDSGNKALANQMVFVGKIAIIVLALPVFTQIMEIIGNFIK